MPKSTIATQFHETLYVHGDISPKFTFNLVFSVKDLSDRADLILAQLIRSRIKVYARLPQYLSGSASANPIDISQTYLHPLVFW